MHFQTRNRATIVKIIEQLKQLEETRKFQWEVQLFQNIGMKWQRFSSYSCCNVPDSLTKPKGYFSCQILVIPVNHIGRDTGAGRMSIVKEKFARPTRITFRETLLSHFSISNRRRYATGSGSVLKSFVTFPVRTKHRNPASFAVFQTDKAGLLSFLTLLVTRVYRILVDCKWKRVAWRNSFNVEH